MSSSVRGVPREVRTTRCVLVVMLEAPRGGSRLSKWRLIAMAWMDWQIDLLEHLRGQASA